jgi:hypothetical protein
MILSTGMFRLSNDQHVEKRKFKCPSFANHIKANELKFQKILT